MSFWDRLAGMFVASKAAAAPAPSKTLFDAVVDMARAQPKPVSLMDQLLAKTGNDGGSLTHVVPANPAQHALDMIANAPEPPPPDKFALPHVITFSGLAAGLGKIYRNPDEAIRASRQNARYMRNDLLIMECLEARQRATALLPWHVEPEDPKDPGQQEAAAALTAILERIPRFTEFRRSLLEAIWYGREATQNIYGEKTIKGTDWFTVMDWQPINGDKLAFKWDGRVGIRVGMWGVQGHIDETGATNQTTKSEIKTAGRLAKIEMVPEYGRAYFLSDDERERTIVHKHMVEDGDFEDPISAGAVHGVGIRSRIYWTWFQKQSVLALLMEHLERGAFGFDIWTFPWGNPQAEQAMRIAAEQRVSGNRNIVLVPVMPGQEGLFQYEHKDPSLEGARLVNEIVHQFFQWQIKRYILGQILSTEPEGGGLGSSGLSDLHKDSLMSVVNYDCRNLEETLTEQLLAYLVRLNKHKLPESARNARFRFVIDSESADIKESMEALEKAWNMNLPIAEKELYKITGLSAPDVDDKVLQGPSGGQGEQPGMPGAAQTQAAPPANLLEQLVQAQYIKDAHGHEHSDSDGKFVGQGGSGGNREALQEKADAAKKAWHAGGSSEVMESNRLAFSAALAAIKAFDKKQAAGLPKSSRAGAGKLTQVPISKIEFSEDWSVDVSPMSNNDRQPIIVVKKGDTYRLLDGFGRTSGLNNAGRTKAHAIIVTDGDLAELGTNASDDPEWVDKMYDIYAPNARKGRVGQVAYKRLDQPHQYSRDRVAGMLGHYSLEAVPHDCEDPTGYIAHAAAHALDNGTSDTAEWRDAWQEEISGGNLTRYAASDRKEGFAEFGRLVVKNSASAREHFPQCWGVWESAGIVEPPAKEPEPPPLPEPYARTPDTKHAAWVQSLTETEIAKYTAPRNEQERNAIVQSVVHAVAETIGVAPFEAAETYINPQNWVDLKVQS